MSVTLAAIRNCLEGAIPSVIATCAPDGVPNVAYLSQVHYVDDAHVALSFQFFNKTRENVLANPYATVQVVDPETAAHYRLAVQYLRTETEGPLFESMKAKLTGIASHTGMSKIFRLRGADIYRLLHIERMGGNPSPNSPPRRALLPALRTCTQRLGACHDLDALLDEVLLCLQQQLEVRHAIVLMYDAEGQRLYTVATCGYPESGVGSEVPLGAGVIGVAARERTPIRITHMAAEYAYSRAVRQSLQEGDHLASLDTEIPFPGLPAPHSQLAVPILRGGQLLGVVYVESPEDLHFTYEDEDALVTLAAHLAMAIYIAQQSAEVQEEKPPQPAPETAPSGAEVTVRHYPANNSVFIDEDYLIKGVAGAIFWKLLAAYHASQRTEFSNRELRLDPAIGLPDFSENLEARLILLQRRLAERCSFLRIEKTGRGRFRLHVDRPIKLAEMAPQQAA